LGAQSCLQLSLRSSIPKKPSFRPSKWPRKLKLLKIVNCQNCQKTILSQLEKVGGHRYPPGSQVLMGFPQTWLEATKRATEAQQVVFSQNKKPSFVPRSRPTNPNSPITPLKVYKLTRYKMVECQLKGFCYNFDEKYFSGKNCKEQNFFMAISEDVLDEDVTIPLIEEPSLPDATQESIDPPEVEPLISLHAITKLYGPQTLKLIGYIKNRKVIILVDSGRTHNFIHRRITQETNCYIRAINNFQIMIANGGSMKCGGHCENVCLQIGHYHLKSHMFSIEMGGCDILLGDEWLHTLSPILMDFKELTMQFQQEGKLVLLRSSVPIAWKRSSINATLILLLNSILFMWLRHPLCILTSKLFSPNTK
jgi:hypothetical protein